MGHDRDVLQVKVKKDSLKNYGRSSEKKGKCVEGNLTFSVRSVNKDPHRQIREVNSIFEELILFLFLSLYRGRKEPVDSDLCHNVLFTSAFVLTN